MQRFWQKVNKTDSCWIWIAGKTGAGYGGFWFKGKTVLSHIFSYELVHGKVPAGLELDHLCRNRACINPEHLEAVTHSVNVQRGDSPKIWTSKTHCPRGHEYSGDHLYKGPTGGRRCRECRRILRSFDKCKILLNQLAVEF